MPKYQVVEKDDFGTDWAPVRFNERLLARFDTENEATVEARAYVTDRNCNNALTPAEKLAQFECFMLDPQGCYLGDLDGSPWYLEYPKDIKDRSGEVVHSKGTKVADRSFFMLEGKTEVKVRTLPGT
jgi:hypothetical protein